MTVAFDKNLTVEQLEKILPKVLLIEDEPSTRWIVRTALKDHCFLATAAGVIDGIRRIEEYRPDVIFLDINLIDGSGFTILEWVVQKFPHMIVVMFSGNNDVTNMSRALLAGAYGFVSKPFQKEELLEYLHT